jgi:hypothetical protein
MKAFPALRTEQYQDVDGNWRTKADDGMDLRDYFAAKAMQGIVDSSIEAGLETTQIADSAYRIADAMMKARNE